MTFEQWMHSVLGRVETALEHYLPAPSVEPAQLHEATKRRRVKAQVRAAREDVPDEADAPADDVASTS